MAKCGGLMLNILWALMILCGILCAAVTGNVAALSEAAIDSAGDAVSLCITMTGVVAPWMGLMEIAKESGLVERMTKGIAPFLYFLFPKIPKDHPAFGYISANVIANVLGLGWACTPPGLKAMEELARLERERGNPQYLEDGEDRQGKKPKERWASEEMCTFLILNVSSLQLIPVNMIAYRRQYGSSDPAGIILPAILATLVSTLVAVMFSKLKSLGRRVRNC